jgi:hypothetical protein
MKLTLAISISPPGLSDAGRESRLPKIGNGFGPGGRLAMNLLLNHCQSIRTTKPQPAAEMRFEVEALKGEGSGEDIAVHRGWMPSDGVTTLLYYFPHGLSELW